MNRRLLPLVLALGLGLDAGAQEPPPGPPDAGEEPAAAAPDEPATPPPGEAGPIQPGPAEPEASTSPGMDNGLAIYVRFQQGLAEPECDRSSQARWQRHFAHAPQRLANPDSDALALFAHVVDALRESHLPTEFALIPFVESGYAPGARSKIGPAGLWQFIGATARNHGVQVGEHYDGRLSPADSTRAAVRYIKTLHGMFGGNWRLTAMAYNAGENRVLQALRRSGSSAIEASPSSLSGLSPVTYAYVEKLHALACVIERAGEDQEWRSDLDRPVMRLQAMELQGVDSLKAWAARNGADSGLLHRINPALASGRWPRGLAPLALVPVPGTAAASTAARDTPTTGATAGPAAAAATGRSHTVRKGESAWTIARRHGIGVERLLELNGLGRDPVLRPGMKLRLD